MLRRYSRTLSTWGRAALALALAPALLASLGGCTDPGAIDSAPDETDADEIVAAASLPLSIGEVCPEGQRVGRMQVETTCPGAQGWNPTLLFGANAPAPLSQYCLYNWTGGGTPQLDDLPEENNRDGALWTQPDCMAVTATADSDVAESIVQGALQTSFWNAVERPASLPLPGPGGTPVQVDVPDTWPNSTAPGNSRHGVGMAGIIQDLTCDVMASPGSCPVVVFPELALNMLAPGLPDNTAGGTFGHQSRLATAIRNAVAAWQLIPTPPKLIINLSVGWDPIYQTDPGGADRPSALAVRDAIDHAVCSGALVIAAAGNSSFGPSPTTGLMYPAAWSTQLSSCPGGAPLVWAVGGVDNRDQPLFNARPGGMPKLAAPGQLAYSSASLGFGVVNAGPFTGSSASAAVASAAAAAVWMYDASLTGPEVMAVVNASALPLSTPASACAASGCGTARRISICRAARAMVGSAAVPCALHGEGGGMPPVWDAAQSGAIDGLATREFFGPASTISLATSLPCTKPVVVKNGTVSFAGPSPCPLDELPNAMLAPSVGPQPGPDPCGACAIGVRSAGDPLLQIAVSSELQNPVHLEVLSLYKGGVVMRRYDAGSLLDGMGQARAGFLPGKVYSLHPITDGFVDYDAAVLEWINTPGIQTTSQVVVY